MEIDEDKGGDKIGEVSGYDPDLFVDNVDQDFICPICTCVARDPLRIPCDCVATIYCARCLVTLPEPHSCPTCRMEFAVAKCESVGFVKGKVESLKVKCQHHEQGCTATFVIGKDGKNLNAHKGTCIYESVKCPKCKTELIRKDLSEHDEKLCPFRMVTCSHCQAGLQASELKQHQSPQNQNLPCENMTQCLNQKCNQIIPKDKLQEHVKQICEFTTKHCPICEEDILLSKFNEHIATKLGTHFNSLLEEVMGLREVTKKLMQERENDKAEIKELRETVGQLREQVQQLQQPQKGPLVVEKKLPVGEQKVEVKQDMKWGWVGGPLPKGVEWFFWTENINNMFIRSTRVTSPTWINLQSSQVFAPNTGTYSWQIRLAKYDRKNGWNVIGGVVTDSPEMVPRSDDLAIIGYKFGHNTGLSGIGYVTGYGCVIDGSAPAKIGEKKNVFLEGDILGHVLDTNRGTLDFYKNTQLIASVRYPQFVNLRASVSMWGPQTIQLRILGFADKLTWS